VFEDANEPGKFPYMRLRRIAPWLILFELLRVTRDHWDQLDPSDRAEVTDLMRRSRGNPRNLTPGDRAHLRDMTHRLHLGRLAISLGTAAVFARRRHKGR
jgi:hypothetical protein